MHLFLSFSHVSNIISSATTPTTAVPRDSDGNSYSRHINLQLTYSFQNNNSHHSLHMNNNNNNNTSTTNNNNINNNNSTHNNNSINGNNNSTKSSLFTSTHGNFFFLPSLSIFRCLFSFNFLQMANYCLWSNITKSANESQKDFHSTKAPRTIAFDSMKEN